MKKWIVLTTLLLSACASKVTATSEVAATSTPLPTETPMPTPTLHPQFSALQEKIANSGERFTLQASGTIQDGAEIIPGLTVAPDGTMKLDVNGQIVTLDPADVDFYDEKGITIKGYELITGVWVEIVKETKEIPLCGSMYDVLTPANKLTPEHIIDPADLQKVANWVQTQLTTKMFDPAKIKPLSEVGMDTVFDTNGKLLIPETETAPNYQEPGTAPFLKNNQWCGTTMIGEQPYLVINVPYYIEGVPPEEWPVVVGLYQLDIGFRGAWSRGIERFVERLNVVPWYLNEESIKLAEQYPDPLTGENFTRARVEQIFKEMERGKFDHTHGLVLHVDVFSNNQGWTE